MIFVFGGWTFLRALLSGSSAIALEHIALHHQLTVLQRSITRPRLTRWDRILWVWLARSWTDWQSSPPQSWRGIVKGFACTGAGSPGRIRLVAPGSTPSFVT